MWNFPLFPEQASAGAKHVDMLYFALLAISAFFITLIFVLLISFAIKYRRGAVVDRVIRRKDYLKLELTWIIIPFIISIGIFAWGAKLYVDNSIPPGDALEMHVVAKQWMWKIQHPRGNREINELHIPVNRPIKLSMTSQDVIHSFYVPAFRVKHDVLPGRYTEEWFEATKTGEYHLFCAEFCGTGHSAMIGKIVVMEPQAYEEWLAKDPSISMAASGAELYERFACATCHKPGGRGPTLLGVFGKPVTLENGETVLADREYLHESITDPMARIVKGYPRLMPSYKTQLSEDEVNQIIEYIKSMNGEERKEARNE